MTIHEPMTMFTDYLIAIFCLGFAYALLKRQAINTENIRVQWAGLFCSVALASIFGGSRHGLSKQLPPQIINIFWMTTLIVIGLASMFLLIVVTKPLIASRIWKILIMIKFIVIMILEFFDPDFFFAMLDYGSALLVAVGVVLFSNQFSVQFKRNFVIGFFVTLAGIFVQSMKIAPHKAFDHNALYHVIQVVSLYFFFKSAKEGFKDNRIDEIKAIRQRDHQEILHPR